MKKFFFALLVWLGCGTALYAQPYLFGMTTDGGQNGSGGVIFSLNAASDTYTKLKNFSTPDNTDPYGGRPYGSFVQAANGLLYATTIDGNNIVSFDPVTNTLSNAYTLTGQDGNSLFTTLLKATNGLLYGVALHGGANNWGTLFSFNPVNNTFTKLKDFGPTKSLDGYVPTGSLMQAANGLLYGMTQYGGSNDAGVLFSFDPVTKTYAKLYDFLGNFFIGKDGALVQASNGLLYGLNYSGGKAGQGELFSFNLVTNTLTSLHEFGSFGDGAQPNGHLIIATDGKMYGMTYSGDGINNNGVIFSFDPATNVYAKLKVFTTSDGGNSLGSLVQASNGLLYGMTQYGGSKNLGTVFSFDPASTTFTKIKDFSGADGATPTGNNLIEVKLATPATLSTSALTATQYCQGATLSVAFTAGGTYDAANIFTAQLSDALGSFASPVNIGSIPGTASGSINGIIPGNQTPGTGYRIRVVSSNPALTTSDNGTNISIGQNPVLTLHNPAAVCAPATANLTDASITAGSTLPSGTLLSYYTDAAATIVLADPMKAAPGTYYIKATTPIGCNDVEAVTVPPSLNSVTAPVSGGDQAVCEASPLPTLTATATPGANATLVWYDQATGGNVVPNPTLHVVGSITYYAASKANNGYCDAAVRTPVTLTIKPAPKLTSTPTPPAVDCNNSFTYTPTASLTGTTFSWSRTAVAGISNAAATGTGSINEKLINTTNAPVKVTYVYNLANDGCLSLSAYNVVVTMNPCPLDNDCTMPPTFLNDKTIVLDASKCGGDGNISIVPLTGTAPFLYSINGGTTYVAGPNSGYTFQNLAAGSYQLRLKDANGCESAVVTREVQPNVYECPACTPPTFLNNQTIVLDASCAGNDGNITIIPKSGTPPFQYSINGGATYVAGPNSGYTFMGLSAGTYQLRLKDGNGCPSATVNREVKANAYGNCPPLSVANPRLRSFGQDAAATVQVYPNPAKGKFTVTLDKFSTGPLQIVLLNANGITLQEKLVTGNKSSNINFDLSGKPKGLYFIRVAGNGGVAVKKILVE